MVIHMNTIYYFAMVMYAISAFIALCCRGFVRGKWRGKNDIDNENL